MSYNDDKKPEPHYTVHIKVVEVMPEHRTGSGVQATIHQRQTEDVLNVAVRSKGFDTAIDQAIAQANSRLPNYAQLHGWIRTTRAFSYGDGLLTANGRPRRSEILATYRKQLATLQQTSTQAESSLTS